MPSIVWLPEALADLQRLFDFLKEQNPIAARDAAHEIRRGADKLEDFPSIGIEMPDDTGRRELFIPFGKRAYVLRYRLDNDDVVIIRVWHSYEQR